MIERSVSFSIHPDEFHNKSVLADYVYGHHEGDIYYFDVVLGYGMFYSHHPEANVVLISVSPRIYEVPVVGESITSIPNTPRPHKVYDFVIMASRDIEAGEELYHNYGSTSWFIDRNMVEIPLPMPNIMSMNQLSNQLDPFNIPGCPYGLTDVYGGRVFAKNMIMKGTVIEVNRGLMMSPEVMVDSPLAEYAWRSMVSDQVILVLGQGSLYRTREDNERANVEYSWYDEYPESGEASATLKFVATADIDIHEELIINLFKMQDEATGKLVNRYAQFNYVCF